MEEDKNADTRSAWNRPSNGDSGSRPLMGAFSWPPLSHTTNAPSSSVSLPSDYLAGVAFPEQRVTLETDASASSAHPDHPFPRGQNHRNHSASQSHGRTQHHNSNKNQHPRQTHANQNWNFNRNFNGRVGFVQPGFARPAPPPMPPIHAQYMPIQSPFYPLPFSGPMLFHGELAQPVLHYPPPMPFIEPPPPVYYQFQDPSSSSLETKIRKQVQYYFGNDNLSKDSFLRKHMNDEGFVHVQLIASFSKVKELTNNIKLILESLQDSDVVEVKGYELRNRHNWRRFLLPPHLRIPFYPDLEDE